MFFRRWSPTVQLLAALLAIIVAPILITELGTFGMSRIEPFLDKWQALIAGSFAVLAAYITINEMRTARQKTEEFWIADRKRLLRLEVSQARKTIFNRLNPSLDDLGDHQVTLKKMADPAKFDPKNAYQIGRVGSDLMLAALDPEIMEAFETLDMGSMPLNTASSNFVDKAGTFIETFKEALAEATENPEQGEAKVDFSSEAWKTWPDEVAKFEADLEAFVQVIIDILADTSVPEN